MVCSSTTQLNTELNVSIDGSSYSVKLCDDCEDISMKSVRNILSKKLSENSEKQKEINELMNRLKELGAPISMGQPNREPAVVTESSNNSFMVKKPSQASNEVSSMKILKQRPIKAPTVVSDEAGPMDLGSHDTYELKNVKTVDGAEYRPPRSVEKESQVISDIAGKPIPLPKRLSSEAGDTIIKIVKTSDNDIQRMAKDIADESIQRDGSFTRSGYSDAMPCNFCAGSGNARIGSGDCPRCHGSGLRM